MSDNFETLNIIFVSRKLNVLLAVTLTNTLLTSFYAAYIDIY